MSVMWHIIASLFLTTILYGSAYKRYCEYKPIPLLSTYV